MVAEIWRKVQKSVKNESFYPNNEGVSQLYPLEEDDNDLVFGY